jgi:hypothetical protein
MEGYKNIICRLTPNNFDVLTYLFKLKTESCTLLSNDRELEVESNHKWNYYGYVEYQKWWMRFIYTNYRSIFIFKCIYHFTLLKIT